MVRNIFLLIACSSLCFGQNEKHTLTELFDPPCFETIWIPHFTYRGGNGISYDAGYESLGTLLAFYHYPKKYYPFLSVDLLKINDGNSAASCGAGWRFLSRNGQSLFGVNAFYDFRRFHSRDFYQVGLGAELLGPCWDVRINGYIPLGQHAFVSELKEFAFPNNLVVSRELTKLAMWGLDLEIGACLLDRCCFNLYGAVGPYFYNSRCCNTLIGGMGRLALKCARYLTVQLMVTHDPTFHTRVQGEVQLSILFPCLGECLKCIFPPIWRNRVIVLEDVCLWDSNF